MIKKFLALFARSHRNAIKFDSLCPACGHRGCTLKFIEPQVIVTDENKGTIKRDIGTAMIERTCKHCGARCYQKPVVPAKEWLK